MSDVKLCINCFYHSAVATSNHAAPSHVCGRTSSLVTGQTMLRDCAQLRFDSSFCGAEAKWFEPKPSNIIRFVANDNEILTESS